MENVVDFTIEELDELIQSIDLDRAKLIWRTMHGLEPAFLKARLQKNRSQEAHIGHSTIVHELRQAPWVPQWSDGSVKFVLPCDASECTIARKIPLRTG